MTRNWLLSVATYGGALILLLGVVSVWRPVKPLGIARHTAVVWIAVGLGLVVVLPLVTPPPRRATAERATHLDDIVPAWDFAESHDVDIAAPAAAVDAAMREVTPAEMPLFRVLTWIRSPRLRRRVDDILHAPATRPLLEVATQSTFVRLADARERELVFGTLIGGPRRDHPPTADEFHDARRVTRAVMNFRIELKKDGGCRLVTQTRVIAPNARLRRIFDYYWRAIFPGSSLIRYEWLRAIKRRAERSR